MADYLKNSLVVQADMKGIIDPTQVLDEIYLNKDMLFMGGVWNLFEGQWNGLKWIEVGADSAVLGIGATSNFINE